MEIKTLNGEVQAAMSAESDIEKVIKDGYTRRGALRFMMNVYANVIAESAMAGEETWQPTLWRYKHCFKEYALEVEAEREYFESKGE
jgi:hypothetical protein